MYTGNHFIDGGACGVVDFGKPNIIRRKLRSNNYIIGDWAYADNVTFGYGTWTEETKRIQEAWGNGHAGENLLYVGGGMFWGHISDRQSETVANGGGAQAIKDSQYVMTLGEWNQHWVENYTLRIPRPGGKTDRVEVFVPRLKARNHVDYPSVGLDNKTEDPTLNKNYTPKFK